MNPSKPIKPDPVVEADSKEGIEGEEQAADVSSDRSVEGARTKRAPLPINEIEDLANDAEGG
ncbi:MAG TPA: hypothetical protein VGO61_20950 [Steroidobacteraceae bacterium]|jgi:hypothetical protein|nr:hypothetical protein [Steroidobacteraceae bacterium]